MLKWMGYGIAIVGMALPAMAQNDATLPDGAGKDVVKRMCVGCHALTVITSKRATPEQWANIVQQMVSRGADGTDDDIEKVTHYLSVNFPSADKTDAPPVGHPPAQQGTEPSKAPSFSLVGNTLPRRWRHYMSNLETEDALPSR
ncbi:MAG TPA: cytochrome c [Acidobacteriaceae bacterium]|jgi:hypothetical protein|nr:cytochrome c [Acidobacteriaceae bacterium]